MTLFVLRTHSRLIFALTGANGLIEDPVDIEASLLNDEEFFQAKSTLLVLQSRPYLLDYKQLPDRACLAILAGDVNAPIFKMTVITGHFRCTGALRTPSVADELYHVVKNRLAKLPPQAAKRWSLYRDFLIEAPTPVLGQRPKLRIVTPD